MTLQAEGGSTVPPVVYVPAQRTKPGQQGATLELRSLQDGRVALLVYSALDRLIDACGEFQPWALLPSPEIERLKPTVGFDVLILDVALPVELQHGPEALGDADAEGATR